MSSAWRSLTCRSRTSLRSRTTTAKTSSTARAPTTNIHISGARVMYRDANGGSGRITISQLRSAMVSSFCPTHPERGPTSSGRAKRDWLVACARTYSSASPSPVVRAVWS